MGKYIRNTPINVIGVINKIENKLEIQPPIKGLNAYTLLTVFFKIIAQYCTLKKKENIAYTFYFFKTFGVILFRFKF